MALQPTVEDHADATKRWDINPTAIGTGTILGIEYASADPNGSVAAKPGMLCVRLDQLALYLKESGTGNTGWVLLRGKFQTSATKLADAIGIDGDYFLITGTVFRGLLYLKGSATAGQWGTAIEQLQEPHLAAELAIGDWPTVAAELTTAFDYHYRVGEKLFAVNSAGVHYQVQ